MDQFIPILDSSIWPVVVLVIFLSIRKPLVALLSSIEHAKFKGVELSFRKELESARAEVEESGIDLHPTREKQQEIIRHTEKSSTDAIVEAWQEIEQVSNAKVSQLVKNKDRHATAQKHPVSFLKLTGALSPSTAKAIRNLRSLRDQVVDTKGIKLSKEDVLEYLTLAEAIKKQIGEITELPKQKLTVLTLLIAEYNQLIDTGKYGYISIEKIRSGIEKKNVLQYLEQETGDDADFSMFTGDGLYSAYVDYYLEQMYQLCCIHVGNERRKWGIENSGLCLLVAWTNELVQQGSGWLPYNEG